MYITIDYIQNVVPKSARDCVNMCATDGKIIVNIARSNTNGSLTFKSLVSYM
jgi:hypothetical protein